jgi:hypothetical protein
VANGERFNVIVRHTNTMRRLSDADRRELIDAAPNVIGFDRFVGFTDCVRSIEIHQAVSR